MNKAWINPVNVFAVIVFTVLVSYLTYGIYQNTRPKPEVKASQVAQVTPVAKPVDVPLNADKILELVNAERAKVGVAPLVSDPRLVATAQARADDMVQRNYFSHNDPVTGESLVKIRPTNPECVTAGENIVWIKNITPEEDNREAISTWMNSKPHHDAMLDARNSLTGIGIKDKRIVQHFCQQ